MTYYSKYRTLIRRIFVITLVVSAIFAFLFWPEILGRLTIASDDEGLVMRKYYADQVLNSDFNWFGVGIGNFVGWLMAENPFAPFWTYQPVHNVYLLIYSETGFLGILTFLLFLIFLLLKSSITNYKLLITLSFLFIGLFDHFLWTLQQGRFALWTVLAVLTLLNKDDIM